MSYYVTNENSFLDIKNAHLRVTGNVHTDVLKLGAIEFQPTGSEVTGTVNFTNVTTGVTTSSNLNVGGTLQLGTVEVVATTHTLANTTALGNVTPHTIEVSNVTTGLVTTANVEVGRDLVVTGNVAVDTNTLFVDSVNDRVGIGTVSPATKLHVEHYGSAIGDFEGIRIANHATNLHSTSRPAYEFVVSDIAAGTGIGASKFAIGYRGTTSASRTDRLVIDASGNVGIGVTSVDSGFKLQVDGIIKAQAVNCSGSGPVINCIASNPGDMISKRYASADRYGMGQYAGGITRLFTSTAYSSGRICFSGATDDVTGSAAAFTDYVTIENDGNVGIGTSSPKTSFGTPAFEVYNGCIMSGERSTSTDSNYSLYVGKGTGSGWLTGYTSTGSHVFAFYNTSPNSGGWNGAVASFYINQNTTTGRSINAGGTVNASGSDYAEYVRKKDPGMLINKGDIVGINSSADLTNVFSEAITFVVKSTNPSYVGGDSWDTQETIVYPPDEPKNPGEDASEEDTNEYNKNLKTYELEVISFNQKQDEKREPYDRIAFCGQVPVNVYNATPGQYIIPIQTDDDTISYELTNTPTFEQYRVSIGKVMKIQEDGRAYIIVKIS